eukprot:tig00020961_g16649.t1
MARGLVAALRARELGERRGLARAAACVRRPVSIVDVLDREQELLLGVVLLGWTSAGDLIAYRTTVDLREADAVSDASYALQRWRLEGAGRGPLRKVMEAPLFAGFRPLPAAMRITIAELPGGLLVAHGHALASQLKEEVEGYVSVFRGGDGRPGGLHFAYTQLPPHSPFDADACIDFEEPHTLVLNAGDAAHVVDLSPARWEPRAEDGPGAPPPGPASSLPRARLRACVTGPAASPGLAPFSAPFAASLDVEGYLARRWPSWRFLAAGRLSDYELHVLAARGGRALLALLLLVQLPARAGAAAAPPPARAVLLLLLDAASGALRELFVDPRRLAPRRPLLPSPSNPAVLAALRARLAAPPGSPLRSWNNASVFARGSLPALPPHPLFPPLSLTGFPGPRTRRPAA